MNPVKYQKKITSISVFLSSFIFLLSMEFIYSPGASGQYNFYILILVNAVFLGIALFNRGLVRVHRGDFLYFGAALLVSLYKFNSVSVSYGLFLMAAWFIQRMRFYHVKQLHIALILVSAVKTLVELVFLRKAVRAEGFMATSATIFSVIMCISIYYLMTHLSAKKKVRFREYVCVAFALICIYLSESRSSILAAAGIMAYCISSAMLMKKGKNRAASVALYLFLAFVAVTLALEYFSFDRFMTQRGNAQDSTNTRMSLILLFGRQLLENPVMLFIGKGGGYTVQTANIPLHQDVLMVLCEYGLVGLIGVYLMLFRKRKMDMVYWAIFLLGTFHNIMTCPIAFIIFFATIRSKDFEGEKNGSACRTLPRK